jgi:hypothetical protein
MDKNAKILEKIRNGCVDIRYEDLKRLCESFFGAPCQSGGNHAVFKVSWPGDPRINIQSDGNGKAKKSQIRQVLKAIGRLLEEGERSPS